MTLQLKRRVLKEYTFKTTHRDWGSPDGPGKVTIDGTTEQQFTWSEGHDWRRKRRSGQDVGGPFDTVKNKFVFGHNPEDVFTFGSVGNDWYVGNIVPYYTPRIQKDISFDDFVRYHAVNTPLGELTTQGTKAINETLPTSPVVDGSVALAEILREGLPSIIGSGLLKNRLSVLRGAGSEYLNYEFGWKPLVADLRNAAKAIIDTDDHLQQLRRDSGKMVRRHRSFNRLVDTWELDNQFNWIQPWPGATTGHWQQLGYVRTSKFHTEAQLWFDGAYTYHYDPGDLSEISAIATQARLLYGAKLDLDVVWNLAPWSWLVDWIANVGPVLSNLSAFSNDGLVLRYGYLMEKSASKSVYGHYGVSSAYTYTGPRDVTVSHSVERKRRIRATPYGFGLLQTSFSTRQWAILAALGMTRGPQGLI